MEDQKDRMNVPESPMMTEKGREELYLYSLKKMADENANKNKIALTQLYGNKPFFYKSNEIMHEYKELKYAVIRMDIYRFKTINEFCGRSAGDALLKFIADCFRIYEAEDTVLGHLRADIFAMCVPFHEKQELVDIVTDINGRIGAYPLSCKALPAFGICVREGDMDISLMCDYADLALQNIKGKVYYYYEFYDKSMREQLLFEKKIENEISGALENNELKVYIQPKVDMENGGIIGGEALIRWFHPKDGYLPPDRFIPVLEKSGNIVEVDTYVWEQVFRALSRWMDNGLKAVPISVNVSRTHVYHRDFTEVLCGLAQKYKVPPQYIILEVTESVFTDQIKDLYENIKKLQKNGFRFSMDDFGSGYSSLNMLKDEPVDEVKIDRIFLKDFEGAKSRIVIRNIVNMIKELDLDMIAEGVETEEQAEDLMRFGCVKAQGFYYYKPMPIEDFEKLLARKC